MSLRILAIDPGSRISGYGVIDLIQGKEVYVDSGCIRTNPKDQLPNRLRTIFESMDQLIGLYRPHEFAIEKVFMHRNPDSALKLGQARGIALCSAALADLPVAEYTPTRVKLTIVGNGRAEKAQVNHMVQHLLKLSAAPQTDAADALAIALCHARQVFYRGKIT